MHDALIIGAGPAGLMAADQLSQAGNSVLVVDAMSSVARKFLMAGKAGLNLTKDEPLEQFLANYDRPELHDILRDFDNAAIQDWARDLGQEIFTGSSGRVFPKAMKTSPLLRAWLKRLQGQGVEFRTKWRWVEWADSFVFDTPDGKQSIKPKACILALGGASWPQLGTDGSWAELLAAKNVELAPFKPANMGFLINWTPFMQKHFGAPVKGVGLTVGAKNLMGEFVISKRGIEGGGIYNVSREMREGGQLRIDLLPKQSLEKLPSRLGKPRGKTTVMNHLRKTLKLDATKLALLQEFARPLPTEVGKLASLIKSLPIKHDGPRPINEAISTAGGVSFKAMNADLQLHAAPNTFCAGEMLDWEAPTGGYLLSACFATGRLAGRAAAKSLTE